MTTTRIVFICAALLLLIATPALAATRTVPSTAYPTIQAAIDAANPGDVISLRPGTFNEAEITIPAAKTDLMITGVCYNPDAAVVDATVFGIEKTAFYADADRTEFRCLSIQHGRDGIHAGGNDLSVYKVHIYHMDDTGIDVSGDRYSIVRSKFKGIEENAIDADGDDGVVTFNETRLTSSSCYEIDGDDLIFTDNSGFQCEDDNGLGFTGDDARIERNHFEQTDEEGLEIDGSRNKIRQNTLINAGDDYDPIYVDGDENVIEFNEVRYGYAGCAGIYVDGDDNTIRNNSVESISDGNCYEICGDDNVIENNSARGCGESGFEIDGEAFTIRDNTVEWTVEYGFDLDCDGRCDEALLEGNTATGSGDDSAAFYVSSDPGLTVKGNVAESMDAGFDLSMDAGTITQNTCRVSGADDDDPGMQVDGNDNLVTYNQNHDGAGSGLEIVGARNTVRSNVSRKNLVDGITICPDSEFQATCINPAGLAVAPSCIEGQDQLCIDAHGAGSTCGRPETVCLDGYGNDTENRCAADQGCVDEFGVGAACVSEPFEFNCAYANGNVTRSTYCPGPGQDTACQNSLGAGATCVPGGSVCVRSSGVVYENYGCTTDAYCQGVFGDPGAVCAESGQLGSCADSIGYINDYIRCTTDARCVTWVGAGATCVIGERESFNVCLDGDGELYDYIYCLTDAACVDYLGSAGATCVPPQPEANDERVCPDNVVSNNTTQYNRGEGIDNQGRDTTLTNNVSTYNRDDCANTGTIAAESGNRCADGSDFDVPGLVDP